MLQRLYVHNFRCLENFELNLKDMPSALLIGKNGAGKSTILKVLEIFQSIGRGINRADQLISLKDFPNKNVDATTQLEDIDTTIRFEIDVLLEGCIYRYCLVFGLQQISSSHNNRKEQLRIFQEELFISDERVYFINGEQGSAFFEDQKDATRFLVDNEYVSLPGQFSKANTLKSWLAKMILLTPIPGLMKGESKGETLHPIRNGSNFGTWVSGLLSDYPDYAPYQIAKHLRELMPDIHSFLNEPISKNAKSIVVRFKANNKTRSLDFEDLSDGEKCFFLCAVVLTANEYYGPLFCFWDEPDNYLSLSEVGHFLMSLRRAFKNSGQILVTSHNEEAIRKFSDENTFVLDRKSHLEPTLIRLLSDLPQKGDLVNTLIRGDLEL
jgi:predicted ATPase